jgi:hypothetical protein
MLQVSRVDDLALYHVSVMSFSEFGKRVKGVRHLFLKTGTDAVNELGKICHY